MALRCINSARAWLTAIHHHTAPECGRQEVEILEGWHVATGCRTGGCRAAASVAAWLLREEELCKLYEMQTLGALFFPSCRCQHGLDLLQTDAGLANGVEDR